MRYLVPFSLVPILIGASVFAGEETPELGRSVAGVAAQAAREGCVDEDGDGFGPGCSAGPDCNDRQAAMNPGRSESCNFRDDDCNGLVDDDPACAIPAPTADRVRVPAGPVVIGSPPDQGAPDERPRHVVQVVGFLLDKQEVTNRRYQACVRRGPCKPPALASSHLRQAYAEDARFLDYPAIFVDWHQADTFCRAEGGRLPTEAEWEKAARGAAPSVRTYPWGDEPADCTRANIGGFGSCVGDTDAVGRRPLGASPFGALDMAGNVWEWVSDWYDAHYYARSPVSDPHGPAQGTLKVMRGGCWQSGADSLRVSCRKAELPSTWAYNVGFRCAYPERVKP